MNLIRNLGPATRVSYVVFGLVMVGLAVWLPYLSGLWAVVVGLLGTVVVAEGAVGF